MSVDRAGVIEPHAVILVEGMSDQAALEALAGRRGQALDADGISITAMGGATNIGHFLDLFGPRGLRARLAGLCDEGEEQEFRRGLTRAGLGPVLAREDLERLGFFVCVEDLEDELFDESSRGNDLQRRTFELRKSLVLLRRVVLPMREVVNSLMRRDLRVVSDSLQPYYQDVYDHVLRATEWTESLRDLVTTILETNLTIQSNRMNVITKKVTGWAACRWVKPGITVAACSSAFAARARWYCASAASIS